MSLIAESGSRTWAVNFNPDRNRPKRLRKRDLMAAGAPPPPMSYTDEFKARADLMKAFGETATAGREMYPARGGTDLGNPMSAARRTIPEKSKQLNCLKG